MAIISIAKPKTVRICYRQEKGDPEYGTCLWADFDFDTENYTLQIMSDCGNYSYGWQPTPQSESFFQLCARLDAGYLIYKIADRTQINDDATCASAVNLLCCHKELPDGWESELKSDLQSCCNEQEVVDVISRLVDENDIVIDPYDIWCCIEKDYTANARKIVDVYIENIVPALPLDSRGTKGNTD